MTEAEKILAEELKFDLEDESSAAYYENIVKEYQHQFLRETKMKALLADNVRNRGAYFNKLVQINGKKHRTRRSGQEQIEY